TMPTSAPHPNDGHTLRPAATVASAARGNNSTNSKPRMATETVTAIHENSKNAISKPRKMLETLKCLTIPATVPDATWGSRRDTTSPPTRAPLCTVTRPKTAITSPPTRPFTVASPSTTNTSPVTWPLMRASPRPTYTLSVTTPLMTAGPSTDTTGPLTVSSGAITTPPLTLMRRSRCDRSPLAAPAGVPTATPTITAMATTAPARNQPRSRIDR